jgi:hypothetical protein
VCCKENSEKCHSRMPVNIIFFITKQNTVIYQKYWKMSKKIHIQMYNQPKPYFFLNLLWSHFWIDINKFYTKTFKIV